MASTLVMPTYIHNKKSISILMEYKNTKIFILYLPNNKRYLVLALIFHSCRCKEKLKLAQESRTSAK